jgi:dTDP-4-dehydrorhamnose reductase
MKVDMKILVVGSNGQVGFELCRLGANSHHEVVCVDRSTVDICVPSQVRGVLSAQRPDIVINAAGYTAVDKAEKERNAAFAANEKGPESMAQVCDEIGAAFLHISTDYVFAGDKATPYFEADPVGPTGVYGASKLAGELAIAKVCKRHIILRTAWIFGEQGNNFVKTMLRVAQTRDTIGVVTDQYGAPTSAIGIANALLKIASCLERDKDVNWGIYHFSGAPFTTWAGFAETIFAEAKKRNLLPHTVVVNAISTAEFPTPASRPANSRLDCTKITKEFGIQPDDWIHQLSLVL